MYCLFLCGLWATKYLQLANTENVNLHLFELCSYLQKDGNMQSL